MNTQPPLVDTLSKVLASGNITQDQARRLGVVHNFFYRGLSRSQTKRELNASFPFVDRWRQRWLDKAPEREDYFSDQHAERRTPGRDRAFLLDLVADLPRSGKPPTFSEQTRNRIIATALEKPSDLGVPVERWSHELLADYLVEQGIVESISSTTVGDFLKSAPRKSPQKRLLRVPTD